MKDDNTHVMTSFSKCQNTYTCTKSDTDVRKLLCTVKSCNNGQSGKEIFTKNSYDMYI